MKHIEHLERIAVLCALVSLTACGKKDAASDTTAIAAATPTATAPATAGFSVMDIDMGRHVGPDKKITDKTDDFAPGDTIFASVHTSGAASGKVVAAKWTFENGTTVHEDSQTISPTGDANTEFHIVKPGGWPKGKYTVHIMIDGAEARTKDVTVK